MRQKQKGNQDDPSFVGLMKVANAVTSIAALDAPYQIQGRVQQIELKKLGFQSVHLEGLRNSLLNDPIDCSSAIKHHPSRMMFEVVNIGNV